MPLKVKRKRVNLNVTQKLELIKKLENGKTVAQICDEYGNRQYPIYGKSNIN